VHAAAIVSRKLFSPGGESLSLQRGSAKLNYQLLLQLAASAISKLQPASEREVQSLAAEASALQMATLRDRSAAAASEAAILRAGCDALQSTFPGCIGVAFGAFAEGTACDLVCSLELGGEPGPRRALAASLPADVGAMPQAPAAPMSSVALACQEAYGLLSLVDSAAMSGGVAACADWAAARAAGLQTAQALTAPLNASHVIVGFVQIHFGIFSGHANVDLAALREVADIVGGALFVRRSLAINRDEAAPRKTPSGSLAVEDAALPALTPRPSEDAADAVALSALSARAASDAVTLRSWGLDAWTLPDAELQRLIAAMVHQLGLFGRFRIAPAAFAAFVADVAASYNANPFRALPRCVCVRACARSELRGAPRQTTSGTPSR